MNTEFRRQIFNGFIKSWLTYCFAVWCKIPITQHLQIDNLLTKYTGFILHKSNPN